MRALLEICVDDADGLAAARTGGADRVELCAALALGGLTPPPGLMRAAAQAGLPAMVMIRPRAGDFQWSEAEVRMMEDDIAAVREAGLAGVVIGASLPDGRLDDRVLSRLMQAARGLDVTLHRAVDLCPDPVAAMHVCRDLGIRRVLSSGGARTAAEGLDRLRAMTGHGVTVMPGGGISAAGLAAFATLPLREVHASASVPAPPPQDARVAEFGFHPPALRKTDARRVAELRAALDHMPPGCMSA